MRTYIGGDGIDVEVPSDVANVSYSPTNCISLVVQGGGESEVPAICVPSTGNYNNNNKYEDR